jgi:hypothetical protein
LKKKLPNNLKKNANLKPTVHKELSQKCTRSSQWFNDRVQVGGAQIRRQNQIHLVVGCAKFFHKKQFCPQQFTS